MDDQIYLGLMSGTSLDGLDMAFVRFNEEQTSGFELLAFNTSPYPSVWRERLSAASNLSGEGLHLLENDWTRFALTLVQKFTLINDLHFDVIGFHGQTVFHQPHRNFSFQMGNGALLSALVQRRVISDFRRMDVGLGGHGAPLVPVGDWNLFSEYDACLNLGGFANASFGKDRTAYDLAACNRVLNHYAMKLGKAYDDRGKIASSGKVIPEMMAQLSNLSFYSVPGPKSLGEEWIRSELDPVLNQFNSQHSIKDIMHTYTLHLGQVIGQSFEMESKVLVTGGGAYNVFLMEQIQKHSPAEIHLPEKDIIDGKEAIIFAYLAYLRNHGKVNVLKSVTGGKIDHSAGAIYG